MATLRVSERAVTARHWSSVFLFMSISLLQLINSPFTISVEFLCLPMRRALLSHQASLYITTYVLSAPR